MNLVPDRKEKPIRLSLTRKLLLIITGLVLIKLILLLTSVPKPTVDYLAQANELSKPAGFTPEDNAAPLYEQAFALYVEPPDELWSSPLLNVWYSILTDIDPNDLRLARKWLDSSRPALEQTRLAVQKPYCWFERTSEDGSLINYYPDEYLSLDMFYVVLVCSAKCHVIENQFPAAAEDILTSCRLGLHFNRSIQGFMLEFECNAIAAHSMTVACEAIAYAKPSASELESFQYALQSLLPGLARAPSLHIDKLVSYDLVQRLYLGPIRGIDRPAFRVLMTGIGLFSIGGWGQDLWKEAFRGYSRYRVMRQIDRLHDLHSLFIEKTPWQIYKECQHLTREAEELTEDGFFMQRFVNDYLYNISRFHKARSRIEALITVTALLRYQQDRGRLPDSLDALQAAGYLQSLPMDPYSDGPLVYKAEGDAFTLYSVGEDFTDSGGIPLTGGEKPVVDTRFIRRLTEGQTFQDIIYWPVLVETPNPPQSTPAMGEEF